MSETQLAFTIIAVFFAGMFVQYGITMIRTAGARSKKAMELEEAILMQMRKKHYAPQTRTEAIEYLKRFSPYLFE